MSIYLECGVESQYQDGSMKVMAILTFFPERLKERGFRGDAKLGGGQVERDIWFTNEQKKIALPLKAYDER